MPTTPKIIEIAIGITVKSMPNIRQFLAFFGSSSFMTKYAITPPMIDKNIGKRYHAPLRLLASVDKYLI